ncbi:hypothetical protein [Nocardia tengchongensis]
MLVTQANLLFDGAVRVAERTEPCLMTSTSAAVSQWSRPVAANNDACIRS